MAYKSICLSVFVVLVCGALPIYDQEAPTVDIVPSLVKSVIQTCVLDL